MDIKDISTLARIPAGKASNRSVKAAVAGNESVPSPSTEFTLSDITQSAFAAGVGADAPVFDAGKVGQIKSAIASGQFRVDSSKVADGLLQSVRDLLSQAA
ncbi:MAG: flagellar biosynthesis anti-sigma factor FlgM [Proteobacteria bacterium]|nr:flagellar biosynthesis anti-sigma factor FlgM [Pseudomonadota bacterium]